MSKLLLSKRITSNWTLAGDKNEKNCWVVRSFCFGAKNAQNQGFFKYKNQSRTLVINLQKSLYFGKKLILAIFRANENITKMYCGKRNLSYSSQKLDFERFSRQSKKCFSGCFFLLQIERIRFWKESANGMTDFLRWSWKRSFTQDFTSEIRVQKKKI